MKNPIASQIACDPNVGADARGTHIGIFDITGELPVFITGIYSVVVDGYKTAVWLNKPPMNPKTPYSYLAVDRTRIKESMLLNHKGAVTNVPNELFIGHACFITWYKHREMILNSRNFDIRVPTYKHTVDVKHFHTALYMINLPMYRIIVAAIAVNILTYRSQFLRYSDLIERFFARFPSLSKHRRRVEQTLSGEALYSILNRTLDEHSQFNVNQLTGL